MLLPMLRAVRDMIYIPVSPEVPSDIWKAKIECARVILEEIIKDVSENPNTVFPVSVTYTSSETQNPNPVSIKKQGEKPVLETKPQLEPRPTVETSGDEWMITIDENKGLKIVDFPEDGLVELDGKKMTYKEARGQQFKKARIL